MILVAHPALFFIISFINCFSRANHTPTIPGRPLGNVPDSGVPTSWTVTWTMIERTLTFNAGSNAVWRNAPFGWTLNPSRTQITRTVFAGTAWNTITWPRAEDLYRSHHTPTIPNQPTGNVPATGGTVTWTATWSQIRFTVDITLPMGMMLGSGGGLNQTVNSGSAITQINLTTTSADFIMPETYNITGGLLFTRVGDRTAHITGRPTTNVTHTVNAPIFQTPTRRNVSLTMYLHHSYRDAFSNYRTLATNVVHDANRAFLHPEIDIQFILQEFRNVGSIMPMDGCAFGLLDRCCIQQCAEPICCSDGSRNHEYFRDNIFRRSTTMGTIIHSDSCVFLTPCPTTLAIGVVHMVGLSDQVERVEMNLVSITL